MALPNGYNFRQCMVVVRKKDVTPVNLLAFANLIRSSHPVYHRFPGVVGIFVPHHSLPDDTDALLKVAAATESWVAYTYDNK